MEKQTKQPKEKKQIVEIHIYIHQDYYPIVPQTPPNKNIPPNPYYPNPIVTC